MPRFRFLAADSTGQVSDGTIDAASPTDARNMLASNGLAVRELEEVVSSAAEPVASPRRAEPRPAEPLEPLPARRPPRSSEPAGSKGGSSAPLILSIIALVIALATGIYVMYRDPPGGRLSRYDFRTPETAYKSYLRMEAEGDLLASIELQRKLQGKKVREKLNSLQIGDREEYQGKTVLFIKYEVDENPIYEVAFMERDAENREFFRQSFVFDHDIEMTNPALARRIQEWRMKSQGSFRPPGRGGGAGFEK